MPRINTCQSNSLSADRSFKRSVIRDSGLIRVTYLKRFSETVNVLQMCENKHQLKLDD